MATALAPLVALVVTTKSSGSRFKNIPRVRKPVYLQAFEVCLGAHHLCTKSSILLPVVNSTMNHEGYLLEETPCPFLLFGARPFPLPLAFCVITALVEPRPSSRLERKALRPATNCVTIAPLV